MIFFLSLYSTKFIYCDKCDSFESASFNNNTDQSTCYLHPWDTHNPQCCSISLNRCHSWTRTIRDDLRWYTRDMSGLVASHSWEMWKRGWLHLSASSCSAELTRRYRCDFYVFISTYGWNISLKTIGLGMPASLMDYVRTRRKMDFELHSGSQEGALEHSKPQPHHN